ncbi:MAG TPA: heterodisulfide reductase subunit B [Firmicutes bacterium]|nr:heterodisulfide reductase subunit B [Bacillota bacterium]
MRFGYYPGCSLHGTAWEYDRSLQAVAAALGLELWEVEDWNCCGASSAHAHDRFLAAALPARVLGLAAQQGEDLLVPCAACVNRLRAAQHDLAADSDLCRRVTESLDVPFRSVRVLSVLDFFALPSVAERLTAHCRQQLTGLRVACYYGCLLARPPVLATLDDPENPHVMDDIISHLGGTPIPWPHKVECCGGSLSLTSTPVVVRLVHEILQAAAASGAQAIVTACPLCQGNLDLRQEEVARRYRVRHNIPIYYLTELVAISLGLAPQQIGLGGHMVDAVSLLRTKRLLQLKSN